LSIWDGTRIQGLQRRWEEERNELNGVGICAPICPTHLAAEVPTDTALWFFEQCGERKSLRTGAPKFGRTTPSKDGQSRQKSRSFTAYVGRQSKSMSVLQRRDDASSGHYSASAVAVGCGFGIEYGYLDINCCLVLARQNRKPKACPKPSKRVENGAFTSDFRCIVFRFLKTPQYKNKKSRTWAA
jgi:hypothetical protein